MSHRLKNDPEIEFHDVIMKRLHEEMDDRNGIFEDWLIKNEYLPKNYKFLQNSTQDTIFTSLLEDNNIEEAYYDFRKEDIIRELLDNIARMLD